MAAAAIALIGPPLITAIITKVGPHVPDVIRFVENLFGSGGGGTKLDAAVKVLVPIVESLASGGHIPGAAPTDTSYLVAAIEQALQQMKANGEMGGTATMPKVFKLTGTLEAA